jgi:3-methyladenine DNA glycosylase AlkD
MSKMPTVTVTDTLTHLESLANATTRAHNAKRGVGDNQFGVKLGDLRKLAATIKANHELALALWQTGNFDARLLAVLLMKPAQLTIADVNRLVRSATNSQLADWLNAYVVKEHPERDALRESWMTTDDPWAARAGWSLTSSRINKGADGLDLSALLDRIEREMPVAAPEVQWTMNNCLAGIGIHFAEHRARAIAIGEKVGVFRDFPTSKGCTSPFAPIWIAEMVRRQK